MRRACPGNARFRRSATCLDELLEGLDYYGVDVGHRRCGIWSLRSLSLSGSLRQLHNHWSYGVFAYSARYTALLACKRGARDEQRYTQLAQLGITRRKLASGCKTLAGSVERSRTTPFVRKSDPGTVAPCFPIGAGSRPPAGSSGRLSTGVAETF